MHHHSGTDVAVLSCDRTHLSSQTRDAFLAAFLAPTAYTKANVGNKRSCPFAAPVKRPRLRSPVFQLQPAAEKKRDSQLVPARPTVPIHALPTASSGVDANRLQSILQAFRLQAQRDADSGFVAMRTLNNDSLEYDASVDALTFETMEKNVAEQYAQVAQVFQDAGLTDSITELSDAQVVTQGPHGPFVRFATAKVAPFALDTVSQAMWKGAQKRAVRNMKDLEGTTTEGDGSVVYLKTECMLQDDSVGARGIPVLLRGVCRRYVESDRIVLVWEGRGDWPKNYIRSHPSSVPIRERGYCVVQTVQSEKVKGRRDAAPLSLFQTCVCMTPGLSAGIDMDSPECLDMLSDSVIPSYRKILDAREQMLENALLDEMIQSKMRGPMRR